jgi:hypothetical protein
MKLIKYVLYNLLWSFDTHQKAFSARKLTAFITMSLIVVSDFYYLNKLVLVDYNYYLIIHFIAVFLFLGLVTFDQIIKFKNGSYKNEEKKTKGD